MILEVSKLDRLKMCGESRVWKEPFLSQKFWNI